MKWPVVLTATAVTLEDCCDIIDMSIPLCGIGTVSTLLLLLLLLLEEERGNKGLICTTPEADVMATSGDE